MLIDIIGTLILSFSMCTFIERIFVEERNVKIKYVLILIYGTLLFINYEFAQESVIRLLINWISLSLILKFMYKISYLKSFIISFSVYLILMVLEILSMLFLVSLNNISVENIDKINHINLYVNILISILLIILCHLKNFIFVLRKLSLASYDKKNVSYILLLITLSIIIMGLLSYHLYFDSNYVITFISSLFFVLVYNLLVFMIIFDKKKIENLELKNSEMIGNLKTYEEMVSTEKIKNHENKNSLLILKDIIGKKSVKATKYIDTIINDMKVEDKTIKEQIINIPAGGLQGLIYQKTLTMKQKNINYVFDISRKIHTYDFEKLSMKMLCDVLKIVGVFLDNAIEENDKNKNKLIKISLYKESDKFIISISNTIENRIDISKMSKKGYSTKGKNRGFGLSLVEDILKSNKSLINLKEINSNLFTQKLEIEYKKK